MKKYLKYFLPLTFILIFFSTCIVTSIHPIYNDDETVFKHQLFGTWFDDDSNKWVIVPYVATSFFSEPKLTDSLDPKDYKSYDLEYTDSEGLGKFVFHLVEISGNLFVDFYPYTNGLNENIFLSFHRMPVHSFGHISISDSISVIRLLNYEWFEELIKDTPEVIKHEKRESNLIITAKTDEIQSFLTKFKDDSEAFADSIVLILIR